MPTYEYECLKCGHKFEMFQSIMAPPCEECPECGGNLRKLIGTGAAVIFKGSGFYATDYRSEEYKKKAKEEKSGGEKKEKKDKKESSSSGESKDSGNKNK